MLNSETSEFSVPDSRQKPAANSQRADVKSRPLSFWLHSIVGLKLSLFIGFICLTGTIATVSHEVEWLFKPEVRASALVAEPEWGAMWDAARATHPDVNFASIGSYDRSNTDYFAKTVLSFEGGEEDRLDVYVDPATTQVTGEARGVTFHSFMRGLHYYLFAPTDLPFYIVSAMGLVLLFSMITGLIVYKKFWRGFFRWPRFHRSTRTWIGDLHRLIGLWSLWFVAAISLTSAWYIVERAGLNLNSDTPSVSVPVLVKNSTGADIDRWVALAKAEMPGIAITSVALPYSEGDPVQVQGQWRAWLVRERTNAVFIDPTSNTVLGSRVAHEMPVGERIVHTADPLHFGNFGGLTSKLIWAFFGLLLTAMAFSGAVIYAKRMKLARTAGSALAPLDYLGNWKWPSVIAITIIPGVSFVFW